MAKFEPPFRFWSEGTEKYRNKSWSHGRNLKLQKAAYKIPTHGIA